MIPVKLAAVAEDCGGRFHRRAGTAVTDEAVRGLETDTRRLSEGACRLWLICFMISPILWAISPETPVSISSKMIVGKAILVASRCLIASIIRESSPPEAVFLSNPKLPPLLAEKRKERLSLPFARYCSVGIRLI